MPMKSGFTLYGAGVVAAAMAAQIIAAMPAVSAEAWQGEWSERKGCRAGAVGDDMGRMWISKSSVRFVEGTCKVISVKSSKTTFDITASCVVEEMPPVTQRFSGTVSGGVMKFRNQSTYGVTTERRYRCR